MMKIKAFLISSILALPGYAAEDNIWKMDWDKTLQFKPATYLSVCADGDCSPLATISDEGDSTFNWKVIELRAAKYAPGAANDQWIAIAKLLWDSRQQALAEAKTAK